MKQGDWIHIYENENHIECKYLGKFYLAVIRKVNEATVVVDVILNKMGDVDTFQVPIELIGE